MLTHPLDLQPDISHINFPIQKLKTQNLSLQTQMVLV